jgi:8-oxo-dGTP pyrophosphatase MutT (NUDIX family)
MQEELCSAGLVVMVRGNPPMALVIRRGKKAFELPKGGLEGEETFEEAAIR